MMAKGAFLTAIFALKRTSILMVPKSLLVPSFLLLISSCGISWEEDTYARYPELIAGEWELSSAYRDSVPTRLLDGTFFRFLEGNRMETNLPLEPMPDTAPLAASYTLKADSLLMTNRFQEEQVFVITRLDSQALHLSTRIRGIPFQFDLKHK